MFAITYFYGLLFTYCFVPTNLLRYVNVANLLGHYVNDSSTIQQVYLYQEGYLKNRSFGLMAFTTVTQTIAEGRSFGVR